MNTKRVWDHDGKTTTQRGYGSAHQQMRAYLKATVVTCEHCASATPPRTRVGCVADHIIPLAKGGTGERSNYAWLCQQCADIKDAKDRGKPLKQRPRIGLDGFPIEGGGTQISTPSGFPDRWDTTKLMHVAPVSPARERTMK